MQALMPNYSLGQQVSKTDERIKACGCPNADLQLVGYMLDIGGGEGIVGQMKPPRWRRESVRARVGGSAGGTAQDCQWTRTDLKFPRRFPRAFENDTCGSVFRFRPLTSARQGIHRLGGSDHCGLYCCEHRHFRPGEPGIAAAAPNIGRAPTDRSYNASAH